MVEDPMSALQQAGENSVKNGNVSRHSISPLLYLMLGSREQQRSQLVISTRTHDTNPGMSIGRAFRAALN